MFHFNFFFVTVRILFRFSSLITRFNVTSSWWGSLSSQPQLRLVFLFTEDGSKNEPKRLINLCQINVVFDYYSLRTSYRAWLVFAVFYYLLPISRVLYIFIICISDIIWHPTGEALWDNFSSYWKGNNILVI